MMMCVFYFKPFFKYFSLLKYHFKNELDYEKLNSLEYLDMFIKEVLRMYPIASG